VAALVRSDPDAAPRDVLRVVNGVLYENIRERLQQDEHATLSLISYRQDGELVFAGAHEDMVVLRADTGKVELVPTLGTWVGATRDIEESTQDSRLQLRDGDVLLLYTDGVIEAENGAGEQFGVERLTRALGLLGDQPAAQIRDRLCAAVSQFMAEQKDDIALLVARYRASR
jgi:sigma-B regulation protein RsbU (phosphoserine phosphatase)